MNDDRDTDFTRIQIRESDKEEINLGEEGSVAGGAFDDDELGEDEEFEDAIFDTDDDLDLKGAGFSSASDVFGDDFSDDEDLFDDEDKE